jgi:hypothetical protein
MRMRCLSKYVFAEDRIASKPAANTVQGISMNHRPYGLIALMLASIAAAMGAASSAPVATKPAAATAATQAVQKTFPPNSDGFIQHWLILEPIALKGVGENSADVEKPMFAQEYFKNQLTVLPRDKDKVTVAGKELAWHMVKVNSFDIDLEQFATQNGKQNTSGLFFGVTQIIAAEEIKDVKLSIGSDDSSVWWLNGEEVIRVHMGRAVNPDDDKSKPVTLKKGVNVLRFAVLQNDGPSGACARFFDSADKPLTNIQVSTDAP